MTDAAAAVPGLRLLVLFGSRARDDAHPAPSLGAERTTAIGRQNSEAWRESIVRQDTGGTPAVASAPLFLFSYDPRDRAVIDWWLVGSAALWIAGLAVLLATLSYHDWLAHESGRRLRDQFRTRSWGIPFSLGMTFLCTGLAAGHHTAWWEHLLWGVLALSFAWQLTSHLRNR